MISAVTLLSQPNPPEAILSWLSLFMSDYLKVMTQPLNYTLKNNKNSFLIQQRLGISQQQLEAVCSTWKITELALFGSILRSDFTPDSDIDMLVTFADDAQWGLMDFVRINQQLETYFNRSVDLLTKRSIENSKNWLRKQEILQTAEVIYAQR